MGQLHRSVTVSASIDRVYATIKQPEELGKTLPGFEVRELARTEAGRTNAWTLDVEGQPLGWVQVNEFDDRECSVRFWSMEGDFDRFEGTLSVRGKSEGAVLDLRLRFDFDMPLAGELIGDRIEAELEKAMDAMLEEVRLRCAG